MDLERKLRSLQTQVQILWVVVVCAAGMFVVLGAKEWIHPLRAYSNGGSVELFSSSDGPFVVTHVVAYGTNEPEKRWAALREPLAIIDSQPATIDTSKLQWHNFLNEPASPPTTQRIAVLYMRPYVSPTKK